MEAEIYKGVRVKDEYLMLQSPDGDETSFPSEGLDIDEAWIVVHLGAWLECTVIDKVIRAVRLA
jgi:hypothetical protein